MAKKVLVKDNKVLSLHSGKVLGAPENYDLDTYLNFYMPFGGTITLRRVGSPTVVELEYSTDGGRTWQIWEEVGTDRTLTLPAEGRMWIRNTSETSTGFSTSYVNHYKFYLTGIVYADGNCYSLKCKNPANATCTQFCFTHLFDGNKSLLTLPRLPLKTTSHYCYDSFAYNCTALQRPIEFESSPLLQRTYQQFYSYCRSLKEGSILKEKTLTYQCYRSLFQNSGVQKVITYMTDISATQCLQAWLDGVPSTGDLYCDPSLTLPTGSSGIPSGWTRHDLSELE